MTTTTTTAINPRTNLATIAADINSAHRACQQSARDIVSRALDAGRLLITAKASVPHGAWLPWLRANVEASDRTCRLYMALARRHATDPESATVAGMGLRELAGWATSPGGAERDHAPDEWFSPAEIVEPARALMGGIDLDPASCAEAQAVVKAGHYITAADDGLVRPWSGRCWLNPPYSLVEAFAHKLIEEHEAGNLETAVMLTNASTDAAWFAELSHRYPVLFTRGRVRFWRPDHPGDAPRFGQALFGVGIAAAAFRAAFADLAYAPNVQRGEP